MRQPLLASSGIWLSLRPLLSLWKETRQDFQARVARVAKEANSKCDLRLLCCEYLTRLEMLAQTKGDRLKK